MFAKKKVVKWKLHERISVTLYSNVPQLMTVTGKCVILPAQIHLGKAGCIYSKAIKGYSVNLANKINFSYIQVNHRYPHSTQIRTKIQCRGIII